MVMISTRPNWFKDYCGDSPFENYSLENSTNAENPYFENHLRKYSDDMDSYADYLESELNRYKTLVRKIGEEYEMDYLDNNKYTLDEISDEEFNKRVEALTNKWLSGDHMFGVWNKSWY